MTDESALSLRARERPEAPFVFFRGRRGHFRWLSYAACAAPRAALSDADWAPPEVHELVAFAATLPAFVAAAEGPAPFPPPAGERDVWISWRPLDLAPERRLAAAAVRDGAAIVVERRPDYPFDLFFWARPTLVSASSPDLVELLRRAESEAPRWRRRSWLRQKLGRLRAVRVEEPLATSEVDRLARDLGRLVPGSAADVRELPPAPRAALV